MTEPGLVKVSLRFNKKTKVIRFSCRMDGKAGVGMTLHRSLKRSNTGHALWFFDDSKKLKLIGTGLTGKSVAVLYAMLELSSWTKDNTTKKPYYRAGDLSKIFTAAANLLAEQYAAKGLTVRIDARISIGNADSIYS